MSIKCKLCDEYIEGVCLIYKRKRSSGKKRLWCRHFIEKKIVKRLVKVIRVPWMSKQDKKKEALKRNIEAVNLLEKAKLMEQQKQVVTKVEPKIKERKKGFFQKIFSRVRDK